MNAPERCPECGSKEVRATTRRVIPDGLIDAFVCDQCHWASDPRIGRPPADRSKNLTLRRLVAPPEKPKEDRAGDS